jgi:hypothetical protein
MDRRISFGPAFHGENSMSKLKNNILTKMSLAMTSVMCLSAHGQTVQFPSDGTANSFNSKLPQTEKNSARQTQDLAISYVNYMKETLKLSPAQAAGVVGNLMYASGGAEGLNSGWQQTKAGATIGPATMVGNVSNYSGSGIAQWQDSRKQNLINFARYGKLACPNNKLETAKPAEPNLPTSSQVVNFGFLLYELACVPEYAPVLPALKAETTVLGAVCAFEKLYEQPLKDTASAQRLKFANMVAAWIKLPSSGGAEPTGEVCAKPGGSGPSGGGGNGGGGGGGGFGGGPDGVFTNNANGYGQLKKYEAFIVAASQATGVPVDLIAAVIWDESSGNANVGCTHEPGGNLFDCGLMQIQSVPGSFEATDPATNIMRGAQWIAGAYQEATRKYGSPEEIMNKYHVSAWDLALRLYNSGAVDPNNLNNGYLATSEYVNNIHKFANQLHTSGTLSW